MTTKFDPVIAITNLDKQIDEAYSRFSKWIEWGDDWSEPDWLIESCFIHLLAIAESLALNELRNMIHAEYVELKTSKGGFSASDTDPDGDPYSRSLARIRCFQRALMHMFPGDDSTTVTKDLYQIIRDIHYTIADTTVFPAPPADESEVHRRIEAVLKCVFPDLKHKPTLTKQIKNFEPDTGIPSLRTLIEYKYLSRMQDVPIIADQLLADTRGYTSQDWSRFLYVIYETKRFKRENDWKIFFKESGIPQNTTIVVLSGDTPMAKQKKVPARKKRTPKKS